jgi:hypothetical protein
MTTTRPTKPTASPGYFTPHRVERLYRYSLHHWGGSVMSGRDGIGCPCCGGQVLARAIAPERLAHRRSGDADQPLCDALTEHLRTDCPHAGDAPDLLDE